MTSKAVRRKYDFLAKIYDRIYANYVRTTVQSAVQTMPLQDDGQILDIGCGTGELEKSLVQKNPNLRILGIDISSDMLGIAKKKMAGFSNVTFKEGDFLKVPLPPAPFDIAFSLSNFHYFPDPLAILQKVNGALKNGGHFILIDWRRDPFRGKIYNAYMRLFDPSFVRVYTIQETTELFEKAGFTIQKIDPFHVGILWQVMRVVAKKI